MIGSDGEKSAEAESIVEDIKSEGEIELDSETFLGEDFNTETFDHCFKKMKKEFKNLGAVAILIGLGVIGLQAMTGSDGEKSAEAESIVEDIKSQGEIELDAAFLGEDFNTETFDHCFKKMKKEFKNLG